MDIERQTLATSDLRDLLGASDAYMARLYPAESNHLVNIDSLLGRDFEFYAVKDGEMPVACVAIRLCDRYTELKRLFVKPEWRGRRLGKRLLSFAIDRSRELGLSVVRLETGIHQPEATALFESLGFRRIGPFGSYQEDPLSLFYELS
ncbi:MAG TPA: GNAT family N-acetyltransferase [Alphaproteobacteria bacterium]|nr:GNAT family N-acetyltransferase [Alphaproteobacteria bacterium]